MKRTSFGRLCWACLFMCAIGATASAQELLTISGLVTTRADGLSVPGATVSIVGLAATATTDQSGRYTLQVPRSAVHGERLQVKVDALGLPPTIVNVTVSAAALTVDVALTLGFTEQVTVMVAVGAQNLFDVFLDRNTTVNSFNGIQTFPSQSPFGMNGRSLYARLGWTF